VAKEREHHGQAEASAKGAITVHEVHREFRTINRGFLVAGLVMAIIAVFMAPATVRSLCVFIFTSSERTSRSDSSARAI